MLRLCLRLFSVAVIPLCVAAASAADHAAYTDPAKADADFAYQGEYAGTITTDDGETPVGLQVIALGEGKFHAVGYAGGLPGAGWDQQTKKEGAGVLKDGAVVIQGDEAVATIQNDVATIAALDGQELGQLKKVHRTSPTAGAKPPQGAVVLFDGSQADEWKNGKLTADKHLMQGVTSKKTFGDHKLHVEFCLPYMPTARGQARGNSGLYLQGRYEVQMLDSFGLSGENNECGGLYTLKAPDLNMCFPPLSWQTYDVDFKAAKYDADGKLLAKPRVTVVHNGVVIHKDVELPADQTTRAAPVPAGKDPGPIFLQDHGNPVVYRNIWVQE